MRDFCHVAFFFNSLQILNELVTKNLSFVSGYWCIFMYIKDRKTKTLMLMKDSVGIDYNHNQGLEFCLTDVLQNKQSFPNVS